MWMRNTFLHCWISFSSDQIFKIKSERVCSLSILNSWNRDCAAQTMADQERSHPWWPRWLPGTPAILRQQSWGEWNNFIMVGVFLGLYTDIIIRFSHNGDNDRYYCWRVGGGLGNSSKWRLSSLILLLWKVKDGFEYYDPSSSVTKK